MMTNIPRIKFSNIPSSFQTQEIWDSCQDYDINEDILISASKSTGYIYIFISKNIPNGFKLGYTDRLPMIRFKEWRKKEGYEDITVLAVIDATISQKKDGYVFCKDHPYHEILEESDFPRLKRECFPKDMIYSKEFFGSIELDHAITPAEAIFILRVIKNYLTFIYNDSETQAMYHYHIARDEENCNLRSDKPIVLYDYQEKVIDEFFKKWGMNSIILFQACCRFGKTVVMLYLIKKLNLKLSIVLTGMPGIKDEWRLTASGPKNFEGMTFLDSGDLDGNPQIIKNVLAKDEQVILFLSYQDFTGERKEKHKEVYKHLWDLIVVDETHYGFNGEEFGKVLDSKDLKYIDHKKLIRVSATPYAALGSGQFDSSNTISYPYSEMIKKKKYYEQHGGPNPYERFVEAKFVCFDVMRDLRKKFPKFDGNVSAVFATKNGEFINPRLALSFFQLINHNLDVALPRYFESDQIKNNQSLQHILITAPSKDACDLIEKMLTKKTQKLAKFNEYTILNIAGNESELNNKEFEKIKANIAALDKENKKTISITCNKHLTGVTCKYWDTFLYCRTVSSPAFYDQSYSRVLSPYELKVGKNTLIYKRHALVINFDIDNYVELQFKQSWGLANYVKSENEQPVALENFVQNSLENNPDANYIITESGLQKVTKTDILDAIYEHVRKVNITREANNIEVSDKVIDFMKKLDLSDFNNQSKVEINKIKTTLFQEGEAVKKSSSSRSKVSNSGKKEASKEDLVKICEREVRLYYKILMIFAFICPDELFNVTDVYKYLQKHRKIAKYFNLKMKILKTIITQNSKQALIRLNNDISLENRVLKDPELTDTDKVEIIIEKWTSFSNDIIITPRKTQKAMVRLLKKYDLKKCFEADIPFWLSFEKTGGFILSLYDYLIEKGYNEELIKKCIVVTPVNDLCRVIIERVFELLGLDKNNITKFNSYEILENKGGLKDMTIGAAIGNPPYHKTGKDSQLVYSSAIYNLFFEILEKKNIKYISLVIPSRWMQGGRSLDDFRQQMLKSNQIKEIVDFWNSSDVFSGTDIYGGVSYFLWQKNYKKECRVTYIDKNKKILKSKHRLFRENYEIFIRNPIALKIVDKLPCKENLSHIISKHNPFALAKDILEKPQNYNIDTYQTYNKKRVKVINKSNISDRYINKNYIKKNFELIPKYKIYFSAISGSFTPAIYKGCNETVCTDSFLVIGSWDTEKCMNNCYRYLNTKFALFLFNSGRSSISFTRKSFSLVPLLDFNESWTDEKLYKKFNLTQEEIDYIEGFFK